MDAFAFCKSTLTIALLTASIGAPAQQADPLTQFEVKGHVYEPQANRQAVLKAAKGHLLAQSSIVGTFRKAP